MDFPGLVQSCASLRFLPLHVIFSCWIAPRSSRGILLAFLGAGLILAGRPTAWAQDTATLTEVCALPDSVTTATLWVQDSGGNFYGTTGSILGESSTVFVLGTDGLPTTLYTFTYLSGLSNLGGLILDADGNLYGTTADSTSTTYPHGTVFQITPAGTLTIIHEFIGSDGDNPSGKLIEGSDGNFYGTTSGGGASGNGTVFRFTTSGQFDSLYSLNGESDDSSPVLSVQGGDGSFYGVAHGLYSATFQGPYTNGTVFRFNPSGEFTTLHHFNDGDDGAQPSGLALGGDGNFYGTTYYGGTDGWGTVFRISPAGEFTTLYSFTGGGDGTRPGALVSGGDGNFYGFTYTPDHSTLYQITLTGTLAALYSVTSENGSLNSHGYIIPFGGLLLGNDGSIYCTSGNAVSKLTLVLHPAFFTGQVPLNNEIQYLSFPDGAYFGYYSFLADPAYLYHFDLGYEYVFDAADDDNGVYMYDFASGDFFYTSPTFPFPYLYDFNLKSVLYYFPDTANAGHYTTNPRSFYVFSTGEIISK